ncbi:MAG: hypothetical protein KDA91_17930 [Planctomycetaceae bacterium]|nr:hypothetical protein [Planctomycetaceae bacterium]
MTPDVISTLVTIGLAFTGYLFTYLHGRSVARRESQLERVNAQLRNLYGPLFALLNQSNDIWKAFTENFWPAHGQSAYFVEGQTTDAEKSVWRVWMKTVFMPLNDKIEAVIVENADLIVGEEFPQVFKECLAHIAAYRPVIDQWAAGDFSSHTSYCNWPGDRLYSDVEKQYQQLRRTQIRLIRGLRMNTQD